MGRPKGSKNTKNGDKAMMPVGDGEVEDSIQVVGLRITPIDESTTNTTLEALSPGQQYFEAPDGTILIGDKDHDRMWYRKGGCWVNPKR